MSNHSSTTIRPFLTVTDGKAAVNFYTAAFGATEKKRFELPDNKLSSVIEIDGAEFYVADEEPAHGNIGPNPQQSSPVRIILQTKNADEVFGKALSLGAIQICPMTTEEDWRIGKLRDPFGHVWEIGYILA